MVQQLSLAGFDAPPQLTDRLFFAIVPDVETATRITRLTQQLRATLGLQGRPMAAGRLHITLLWLGDTPGLPRDVVDVASEFAATIASPAIRIAMDRVTSFRGNKPKSPFVLAGDPGVADLRTFQRHLVSIMAKAGLAPSVTAQYTPHITLLYDARRIAEQPVEEIGWTAREFVLVHSLIGRSRHTTLARWPLRG